MILNRDVTKVECPWLDQDLPAGLEVHQYGGVTYGCVGAGVAVTLSPGQTPFFEVPRDAVSDTNGIRHEKSPLRATAAGQSFSD